MRNPARALLQVIRFRGARYLGYLVFGVLLQAPAVRILSVIKGRRRRQALGLVGLVVLSLVVYVFGGLSKRSMAAFVAMLLLSALTVHKIWVTVKRRRAEKEARRLTESVGSLDVGAGFTDWHQLPVNAETRRAVARERTRRPGKELAIGRIDQDGRLLGTFGPLPGLDPVDATEFLERIRFDLDVVLLGDHVVVRKDYRGDRERFVREWHALARLQGRARVPALLRADEQKCRLYMNFIPGRTVRDAIASAGTRIRDCDVMEDPELQSLSRRSRARVIRARTAAAVQSCFSEDFLAQCREQLDVVHRSGVAGLGLRTGNVIVDPDDGSPWLIDFEAARVFKSAQHLWARVYRDHDRDSFNQAFGTDLLTERSAKMEIARIERSLDRVYAPADFGGGLTMGSFWSVKSGTGRWEFLNGRIVAPIVKDRKILDLGSNNALLALLMLRAGAADVVGVEISEESIGIGRVVQQVFEWRDMRGYALRMKCADMESFIRATTERFDVVTAFCSLYYLERDQMRNVVRCSARLADTMIVQANLAKSWETATPTFLERLLRENGFPVVEVHAPKGYARPLLVGRRPKGVGAHRSAWRTLESRQRQDEPLRGSVA